VNSVPHHQETTALFNGFSKLSRQERFARLQEMGALSKEDIDYLSKGGIPHLDLAEKWIENVIGYFQLPLGVATYLRIDEKDYTVPMAVEETSIIAAVSKSAKWIRQHGCISTEVVGNTIIGQIQIAQVKDWSNLKNILMFHEQDLIDKANEHVAYGLVRRGGGVEKITLREVPREDGASMAVIHVFTNCCDAMGANIINQILEYLKPLIEELTHETVTMCILSNLNDSQVTRAQVLLRDIDEELACRIEEASYFAEQDPYRAATHNKGVLNGIDPVIIATGNDWRAVEAGIHAYAARDGQYRSVTKWRYQNKELIGTFEAPIIVGTVGGVTRLHPTAKMCLKMMDIQSAQELSRVAAAVGLVQNLGALRALTTVGIVQGHMKLHIDNLTLSAGANEEEMPWLKAKLEQWLQFHKRVTLTHAIDFLTELRQKQPVSP
jgi:hydroxymethylglutaryl-CoA reductase